MGLRGFISRYDHTIDSHGRLSIPVKFREYLTAHSEGSVVSVVMTTSHVDPCVVVYPLPEWDLMTQGWANSKPDADSPGNGFIARKDYLRLFTSRAVDTELDKQGRILLPAQLREYTGLEKDVVLVGRVEVFEIWDRQKLEQKDASLLQDMERLQEAMASLGI